MKNTEKRTSWPLNLLILLCPILAMALGVGVTILFQVQQTNYGNLIVNLFFLVGCIIPFRLLKYSRRDLGLKVIEKQIKNHVLIGLAVFSFYMLIYIFVIRINGLKPITSATAWGLVTYAVVVFTEEVYFRGILYRYLEKRFSANTALIGSAIIFGIIHARQGLGGIVSRAFAGWIWGSIRYSTGMIFLLIFPIHFAYNSIWLLFEGNWNNPPAWAAYAIPSLEFLIGLAIVIGSNIRSGSEGEIL